MLKAIVIGGTGYTGIELLRLLATHPQVEVCAVTSRSDAGRPVSEIHTSLRGRIDFPFISPEPETLPDADIVFFATPNGTAMQSVPQLLDRGSRIIDLAADFRLESAQLWSQWYAMEHACPELIEQAVYGLPELHRDAIAEGRLVANPGCYPTAVSLGLLPAAEAGLLDGAQVIADAKSGATGAGKKMGEGNLFSSVADNFKAYGVSGHRHLPEILQAVQAQSRNFSLTFVPHLLPMLRGILATVYIPACDAERLQALYEARYGDEPFVDVMPFGALPETASVRTSNMCRIALHRPQDANVCVVLSVIDNLVKGAAGQAIQNMNIMFGFDETCGLEAVASIP